MAMTRVLGTIVLAGTTDELAILAPYLATAETCNAGASAALGMGRFELVAYGF